MANEEESKSERYDPAVFLRLDKSKKYVLGNFALNLIVDRADMVALLKEKDKDGNKVESIRVSVTGYAKQPDEEENEEGL
jgi:hypothetical protein